MVLAYWSEAIVPEKPTSSTLLTVFVSAAAPVLKNLTSSPDPGAGPMVPAVAFVQFAPVDQFVSVPLLPVQMTVAAEAESVAAIKESQSGKAERRYG